MAAAVTQQADCAARRPRVVFVVGTTGAGKTRLGVDLALALGGDVVSADSMQLYRGFDVGSAKVTPSEARGVRHRMVDVAGPGEEYSAARFAAEAAREVEDAWPRPCVVVGGTFFYAEALMFRTLVTAGAGGGRGEEEADEEEDAARDEGKTAEELHAELQRVDPARAERLHPNNERKVRASLRVWRRTGRKHSELLKESGGATGAGPPRFECAVLWLDCEADTLRGRLDRRVDRMVERGLLEEVRRLRSEAAPGRGVAQGIGFKEFEPYFGGAATVDECVARVKAATRRYAKRQTRWIRNRLAAFAREGGGGPPVYRLDTTAAGAGDDEWNRLVRDPALRVARALVGGGPLPPPAEFEAAYCARLPPAAPGRGPPPPGAPGFARACEKCNGRVLRGESEWEAHLKSRAHRKRARARPSASSSSPPSGGRAGQRPRTAQDTKPND